jgi:hypothetical protein
MKKTSSGSRFKIQKGNGTNFSRRNFISSCSACAACFAFAPLSFVTTSCSSKKLRIRVLYSLHEPVQSKPDWPNIGFNFNPVMEQINTTLAKNFPDFEFQPSLATGPEDAEKIVTQDAQNVTNPIDGYIVYQMNCWNRVVQTIAKTGKPVLYADFKYGGSGGFLVYSAAFLRENSKNVGFVASSKSEDLISAVSCFNILRKGGTASEFVAATVQSRIKSTKSSGKYALKSNYIQTLPPEETISRLKSSKILAVRDQNSKIAEPIMGIPLEYIPFSEVNAAWSCADKNESAGVVDRWRKTALEIINIPDETLLTSAAMYLGMKAVLKKHEAKAITINCLGGFYGGHIHAYPCLGFHELGNEGLVGGCECDVNSTATMLAFSTMTNGRPGFISDPVIDTSKGQIIYAHCVAPNRMFGPQGETNPFKILTHSEDRSGASVRSILPVNYITTTLEINNDRKEILFHQAIAVDNDPDDRACRTKLSAEPVGDIEKLFTMWDKWGWHRVTFYGDLKEPVLALAGTMGWKVVEEA